MCGRYTNHMSWREIHGRYAGTWQGAALNVQARSDIRPTTNVVIIRESDGQREPVSVRWGLIPHWAKDAKGPLLHNARSDSVAVKPSFRHSFKHRRCLIPASGFYEWHTEGEGRKAIKTRYYITTKSGEPLTFAGIWDSNAALGVQSCAMITTGPNALMVPIHDRMPVILASSDWAAWLAAPRGDLLRPAPEDDLIAYPVRRDIADEDSRESIMPTAGSRP